MSSVTSCPMMCTPRTASVLLSATTLVNPPVSPHTPARALPAKATPPGAHTGARAPRLGLAETERRDLRRAVRGARHQVGIERVGVARRDRLDGDDALVHRLVAQ